MMRGWLGWWESWGGWEWRQWRDGGCDSGGMLRDGMDGEECQGMAENRGGWDGGYGKDGKGDGEGWWEMVGLPGMEGIVCDSCGWRGMAGDGWDRGDGTG